MTNWREELIEQMAKAAWESEGGLNWEELEFGRKIYLLEARAALAVAEPVIREWCAQIAEREANTAPSFETSDFLDGIAFGARGIAKAIREGGTGNENNA